MKAEHWIAEDECPYGECKARPGEEHKAGCVRRRRSVVISVRIKLVVDYPEDWDMESIESHLNESSSCCDNVYSKIENLAERLEENQNCFCSLMKSKYVREATEEDHRAQYYSFEDQQNRERDLIAAHIRMELQEMVNAGKPAEDLRAYADGHFRQKFPRSVFDTFMEELEKEKG